MSQVIRAPKVLLEGRSGAGKTYSIRTLVQAGITPFVWFTEAMGSEVLEDIPCPKIHWKTIPPGNISWETMANTQKILNTIGNNSLQKMDRVEGNRYLQMYDLICSINKPVCERCGSTFASPEHWGTDQAFVIDGLSGVSQMARDVGVGAKPIMSQPDWGKSMDNVSRFVTKCVDVNCWFVMIAHVEPERDETTGQVVQMASTLGRKLAPQLPKLFSEVIYAWREAGSFYWSTATTGVDTKSRNLSLSDKLAPDFGALVKKWKEKAR